MSEPVRVAETDRFGRIRPMAPPEFFALAAIGDGLYVLDYGPVRLALLVRNRRAPATFYGFHAAMSPEIRRPLPFFQGRKVAPRRLNAVLVCDPSLYLDESVRAGWFLGNRHCRMPTILPAVMDHLDRAMGARRRLLWGVSAGGFAALRYARPGDAAVAVNPQTVLRNFTWGRVRPWLAHGWDATEPRAMQAVADELGDLRRHPPCDRLVYVQNRHDDHVTRHLGPYATAHGLSMDPGDDGRFRLVLGDWGEGHIPPPPRWQARLLREEAARLDERRRGWLDRLRLWRL